MLVRITLAALTAGIVLGATVAPAQSPLTIPSTMYAVGDQIIMSGPTDLTDHERLKRLLDEHGDRITTVVLRNRMGGDAKATMRMMHLIRSRGLRTAVSGGCGSACAYTFLGGMERHLAAESRTRRTLLGYHSMYGDNYLLKWDMVPHMVAMIADYSGGKADRALFHRMIELAAARDFLVFEDPAWSPRADGVSVFLCKGSATVPRMREQCEPIRGTDAFAQGLLTSRELIRINTSIDLVADQVLISGELGPGDEQRIDEVLGRSTGAARTIVFRDVAGNDRETGDRMGHMIRERGLATAISGYCVAACARAFLAGVERRLTDEKPIGRTYLALNGDYDETGTLVAERLGEIKRRIADYTGGKVTAEVLDRLADLPVEEGLIFFLDGTRVTTYGGASIFVCRGPEGQRVKDCEVISGTGSHEQGIFTSPELMRVKLPPG